MKKMKRILALIGVVLLAGLYLATLVFALIGSPQAYGLFRVCVVLTVIVPVLLYAYMLLARALKKEDPKNNHSQEEL